MIYVYIYIYLYMICEQDMGQFWHFTMEISGFEMKENREVQVAHPNLGLAVRHSATHDIHDIPSFVGPCPWSGFSAEGLRLG